MVLSNLEGDNTMLEHMAIALGIHRRDSGMDSEGVPGQLLTNEVSLSESLFVV